MEECGHEEGIFTNLEEGREEEGGERTVVPRFFIFEDEIGDFLMVVPRFRMVVPRFFIFGDEIGKFLMVVPRFRMVVPKFFTGEFLMVVPRFRMVVPRFVIFEDEIGGGEDTQGGQMSKPIDGAPSVAGTTEGGNRVVEGLEEVVCVAAHNLILPVASKTWLPYLFSEVEFSTSASSPHAAFSSYSHQSSFSAYETSFTAHSSSPQPLSTVSSYSSS